MDERVRNNIIKFHTKLINGCYGDYKRQCSKEEYEKGKEKYKQWLKQVKDIKIK